ncbi:MAG: deoxyguanosinetriphosphate triphosphohydrolase [Ignavibacteriaceae bacterium]|nr:deoxyguanosinetriphosphate triphosphohydrolase [Ignavibacteriaceae bacterium]
MNWNKLITPARCGKEATAATPFDGRNEYQKDFDRIVFSEAFRRLQNKTQVIPLPETDFIHTRLTHSIESSCVGRSLGHLCGIELKRIYKDELREVSGYDIEALVAAACLSHDIGNPPFGHSGEDAISEYFRSSKAESFLSRLNGKQKNDLQSFEGNAAGFRLLTNSYLHDTDRKGGLSLTYSTLGVFTKYPKESLPELRSSGRVSQKKFGYFQADKEVFEKTADHLGLEYDEKEGSRIYRRHPLAFLVEAADDISYILVDFEDGYKLKLVSFEEIYTLLDSIVSRYTDTHRGELDKIRNHDEKIGYLRSRAIGALVKDVSSAFLRNSKDILQGKYDKHLFSETISHQELEQIRKTSVEKIYNSKPVIEIETAGYVVLSGLLDAFLHAAFDAEKGNYGKKTRRLIPQRYLQVDREDPDHDYKLILNITMYVGGMTDSYAVETYRKMSGISL